MTTSNESYETWNIEHTKLMNTQPGGVFHQIWKRQDGTRVHRLYTTELKPRLLCAWWESADGQHWVKWN